MNLKKKHKAALGNFIVFSNVLVWWGLLWRRFDMAGCLKRASFICRSLCRNSFVLPICFAADLLAKLGLMNTTSNNTTNHQADVGFAISAHASFHLQTLSPFPCGSNTATKIQRSHPHPNPPPIKACSIALQGHQQKHCHGKRGGLKQANPTSGRR